MVADPIGAYLQNSLSKHSSNGGQTAILQSKLQVSYRGPHKDAAGTSPGFCRAYDDCYEPLLPVHAEQQVVGTVSPVIVAEC